MGHYIVCVFLSSYSQIMFVLVTRAVFQTAVQGGDASVIMDLRFWALEAIFI